MPIQIYDCASQLAPNYFDNFLIEIFARSLLGLCILCFINSLLQAAKKAKLDALRLPDDVLESIEDEAEVSDSEEAGVTGPSHLLTNQSANRIEFDSGSDDDDVDR